ncbi:hypothetical protein L6452_35896 [Arctium lappa]|uniref:Uncharacterized protein n=1 Tax=Arctium lappa TaxID=4217 RepID=A0ACB8YBW8_ARCLA|nr:hypothetical protein L6452_35896 [Arctium lappa]
MGYRVLPLRKTPRLKYNRRIPPLQLSLDCDKRFAYFFLPYEKSTVSRINLLVLCEDLPIETIDNDQNDDLDIQITEIEDETVMGSEDMLKRIGGLEVWKVCNYS